MLGNCRQLSEEGLLGEDERPARPVCRGAKTC